MALHLNQDVNDPQVFMELYQTVQKHGDMLNAINDQIVAERNTSYDIHAGEPKPVDKAGYYDPLLDRWCFL